MVLPPPLAWLRPFCESTGRALDQPIVFELVPTVNPLVYVLRLRWLQPITNKLKAGVWNLFQIWAWKNDSVPQGKVDTSDTRMSISVVIKRRFGPQKEVLPWDKE